MVKLPITLNGYTEGMIADPLSPGTLNGTFTCCYPFKIVNILYSSARMPPKTKVFAEVF